MPRPSKYDDYTETENVKYFTKIFMYNAGSFNNIGPIVEIIRNIDKSIIAHKYGKYQNTIKIYGCQYFHRVIGYELSKPSDYLDNIINGMIKFIFIFSNSSDHVCDNLLNLAEKYKKYVICYSEVDNKYHFYDYSDGIEKIQYSTAIEVINRMKEINEFIEFKKVVDCFPDHEIIPDASTIASGSLDRCVEILRVRRIEEENKQYDRSIKVVPYVKEIQRIIKRKTYPPPPPKEVPVDELPKKQIETMSVKKNRLTEFFKKK
jgi:hypothetical protein